MKMALLLIVIVGLLFSNPVNAGLLGNTISSAPIFSAGELGNTISNTATTQAATSSGSSSGSGSSSSSGSSSGSGGVVIDEPISNILHTDRMERNLRYDLTTAYQFKLEVYKIDMHSASNEDGVQVRVDILKGISNKTPTGPGGEVYRYFNVYSGTYRIVGATIYFKVPDNSYVLMRWNTTTKAWDTLPTTYTDPTHASAKTAAFSNFAIVKTTLPPAPQQQPTAAEPTPPQTSAQQPTEQTAEPLPVVTETPVLTIPGFGLLGALLIILVLYRIKKGRY